MSERQRQIVGCLLMLAVIVLGVLFVLPAHDRPDPPLEPPQITFDVMIDSGNPGPAAHPCASDPARLCFGFSLRQMPH